MGNLIGLPQFLELANSEDPLLAKKKRSTRKRYQRRTPEEQIADLQAEIDAIKARMKRASNFSPDDVRADRERLELSAADYAELVGVSPLTIYAWEHGRSKPRQAALQKWLEVKGMRKEDAWKEVGVEASFQPEEVRAERERLGLSAALYAELVGVSPLTVYGWEKGRSTPRQAQLEKLHAVKGIGKKEAYEQLGVERPVESTFRPETVRSERDRLGLSAARYGELVGVSPLTIYAWEKGRSKPRRAQMEKLLAVKGIGKKEAYERLGIEPAASASGFDPAAVKAERERLELSAADYGELVGVSALTIYSWEKGKTSPREAQLEKWLAVKGIEKEEAWGRLGLEPEFSPEAVAEERERLELSAADYGELVGVSMLTIYNWEKGKSKPRSAQLEKWLAVKGIGKREAWRRLDG